MTSSRRLRKQSVTDTSTAATSQTGYRSANERTRSWRRACSVVVVNPTGSNSLFVVIFQHPVEFAIEGIAIGDRILKECQVALIFLIKVFADSIAHRFEVVNAVRGGYVLLDGIERGQRVAAGQHRSERHNWRHLAKSSEWIHRAMPPC